jgi:hypothetical protein
MACWLLAKPDGWEIRLGALPYLLQQRAGPGERMGRDRVRRMLLELENAGYLTRARSKRPDGRWAWRVELSDAPVSLHRSPTIDGSAVDGSATDGSAVDGSGVDLLNTLYNSRVDKLRTTTTTEPKPTENAVVVVQSMELQFPDILKGGYLTPATQHAHPSSGRRCWMRSVRCRLSVRCAAPWGCLRSLVGAAKRREFSQNYSLRVSRQSSSKPRSPVQGGRPSTATETPTKGLVPASEIAPMSFADWRKKWKPNGS